MEGKIYTPEVRDQGAESQLDPDGIRSERVIRLKRSRGGTLSSITRKRRDIDELLSDPCNIELVKSEYDRFVTLYASFCEAHKSFHKELGGEIEINKSEQYFQELAESVSLFQQKVLDWLALTSSKLKSVEICPDDSASKAGRSRSNFSRVSSRASSLSSVRAKPAMKRAELKAELEAQSLKHSLEQEELHLKMEKEKLTLRIELEKANAREQALQELEEDEKSHAFVEHVGPTHPVEALPFTSSQPATSLNPEVPAWNPWGLPAISSYSYPVPAKPILQANVSENAASVKAGGVPQGKAGGVPPSRRNDDIVMRQNEIMQEIISQQQKATLPKRSIPIFSGDPIKYCSFMRAFEAGIESKETDNISRLYYLEQHTSGKAKELVRSCQHMAPNEGYKKAKEVLKPRAQTCCGVCG